jgi:hypothetical protein
MPSGRLHWASLYETHKKMEISLARSDFGPEVRFREVAVTLAAFKQGEP